MLQFCKLLEYQLNMLTFFANSSTNLKIIRNMNILKQAIYVFIIVFLTTTKRHFQRNLLKMQDLAPR